MANPEHGSGWEVRREFVAPELAVIAGNQFLDLIDVESEYVWDVEYSPEGQAGMTVYRFAAHCPEQFPDFPNTIRSDKTLSQKYSELLEVQEATMLDVNEEITSEFVHVFEPGGHTRRHRDRHISKITVLSLLGLADCAIKDPVTGQKLNFELSPGDAVTFNNPKVQKCRPLHKVTNIGDATRISMTATGDYPSEDK